jgi:hypothetical protein
MSVVDFDPQWHGHPDHRPPHHRPPHWPGHPRPPHPDDCDCGCRDDCDPCRTPDCDSLVDCWNQINALKRIIRDIINDMGGPVQTGPIQGVTDGSTAQTGMIGEVVHNTSNGTFGAGQTQNVVSALVLPPGDWDVQGCCTMTADAPAITSAQFHLSPVPAGMHSTMTTGMANDSVSTMTNLQLTSMTTTASVSVPTLLVYMLTTATTTDGTWQFQARARRMR